MPVASIGSALLQGGGSGVDKEVLWREYVDDPGSFWDNRETKTKENQPDFKRKADGGGRLPSTLTTSDCAHAASVLLFHQVRLLHLSSCCSCVGIPAVPRMLCTDVWCNDWSFHRDHLHGRRLCG